MNTWKSDPEDIIMDILQAKKTIENDTGWGKIRQPSILIDDITETIIIDDCVLTYDQYKELSLNAIRFCAAGKRLREYLVTKFLMQSSYEPTILHNQ